MTNPKSKGRQKFLPTVPPSNKQTHTEAERLDWLENVANSFVSSSKANKLYYMAVLKVLWPEGHGIPGPLVHREKIRDAIDYARRENSPNPNSIKSYRDPFRRVRELQGEEGIKGMGIKGHFYQLIDLTIGEKRVPRTSLSKVDWENVKKLYNYTCPSCHRKEPEVRFQQDHKIPRTRNGGDETENWQPLCDECNNFKSVACRGCKLECKSCCWAFPELYSPINLGPEVLKKLNQYCSRKQISSESLVEKLIINHITENQNEEK